MKQFIKKGIVTLIQLLVRFKIRKPINTNLKYKLYYTKYRHTFFGYYDKTPFSHDNSKLLALATDHDDVMVKPEEATVGYFDLKDKNSFVEVDKTTIWCWQQGCRLMWFGEDTIIYNRIVDGNYGSVVYDIKRKKKLKEYNFSIYDKTTDNRYALSLNFSRLHHLRPGYGYCNFLKDDDKGKILDNDGVILCSLEDNSQKLLIPISKIINIAPDDRMNDAYHYVNHLKFSPNNKSFVFYHIWTKGKKRYTRAIFSDIEGNILKVIDNKTFVSHDTFKNESEYLVYTEIDDLRAYYLYSLEDKSHEVIYKDFREDGHPTYLNNQSIITDTYPDRFSREQKVVKFSKDKFEVLAKISSPKRYTGEFRCDLHPRVSEDKTKVILDIPSYEGRKLMVLEVAQ